MTSQEIYQESLTSAKRFYNTKLSTAQRRAIHHAWTDREGVLRVDSSVCGIPTRRSLERLGLVRPESYVLTDFGRLVFTAQG